MSKTWKVRVYLGEGIHDWARLNAMGRLEMLKEVLDMLRYSGLLESNVPEFPQVIEYEVPHDPKGIIDRWASFGFRAEVVR